MKTKNKKTLYVLLTIGCTLLGFFLWLSLRSVEIVAVHEDEEFSSVLVRNFPFTDRGKISWWLKNKEVLKAKYNIPKPAKDGFFSIVFWDFGDGYKEEAKYDRRCFDDMKPPENCIEKNRVFSVSDSKNMGISFTTNDEIYRMKESGEIVKIKNE
ncbi:hypothetical protein J3D56_002430 [Erwinia persicina]|jgi:hypothetical protein|uniref:DUF943 family protein n=1 Tax=Erwinia aeris TaxID=3239803 RepID=A0ABV4ED65_9GAMM|nr:DUF943 family protein [Erwinia persicina]MCP1438994.1 hypothetical protein [Erwinia persicina]